MIGKSGRLLFREVKTNILSLCAFIVLLTVFYGLGTAMLDFSVNIPRKLELYIAAAAPVDEFEIELSWMNEKKLESAGAVAEAYGTELRNIEGEKNHISAETAAPNYSECEQMLEAFSEQGIQAYSEAYESLRPVYDDMIFFRQVFLFLTVVMLLAFFTVQYSGINMVLKRRQSFICMLRMLGYPKKVIRRMYALIFDGSILLVVPSGACLGFVYEKYASSKLTSLFGAEYAIQGSLKVFLICSLILCVVCLIANQLFVLWSDLEERGLSLAEMRKKMK